MVKFLAARDLGIPIIMIRRPKHTGRSLAVNTIEDVFTWLERYG